jgi:hypothetical protein
MAMTGKDFNAIAEAIADAKRACEYQYAHGPQRSRALFALERATKELATACAQQYRGGYGFNRGRFVTACGFPEV